MLGGEGFSVVTDERLEVGGTPQRAPYHHLPLSGHPLLFRCAGVPLRLRFRNDATSDRASIDGLLGQLHLLQLVSHT